MVEIIAYCGLDCHTCPIHLATLQEDKEEQARMRIEIARLCREQYGLNYDHEDITDCDGCLSESGRLFSGCKNCLIRKCARENGLENCAYCPDYACEKLEALLRKEKFARMRLDAIRSSIR